MRPRVRLALLVALPALAGLLPLAPALPAPSGGPAGPTTRHELTRSGDAVTVTLRATSTDPLRPVLRTDYRLDDGPWVAYAAPEVPILDRTAASYARWRHVGPGEVARLEDGSVETRGGPLGVLWYPDLALGDAAVTLQWRDARTDGCCSNAGVFVRFPDPERTAALPRTSQLPCQTSPAALLPEWVPISCGHEIQVNDGTVDPQATGSVYNFAPVSRERARVAPQGRWSTYEIRTTGGGDYTVVVLRDGAVLNVFRNAPGQAAARQGDPGTAERQFARGFVGLQNHEDVDRVQFRDVRVRDLRPEAAAFTVASPRVRTLSYRSVDTAGRWGPTRTVTLR